MATNLQDHHLADVESNQNGTHLRTDANSVQPLEEKEYDGTKKQHSIFMLLLRFIKIYWKSFIVVFWPLVLLPIIFIGEETKYRCLFIVAIMAVFWVTEALPLPITGLIPIVLYPLMGIMDSSKTCTCYINDTTMMFIGSLVIAVSIENSGLHLRVALLIIKSIGCSHRKLSFSLFFVTMFISMWISNTAATAMMIPIIQTVLTELEAQGLGKMFEQSTDEYDDEGYPMKRPTNTTKAYYLIAAYASSLGGIGTLVGSGTNLTMKGIYETRFPHSPGINFATWMLYAVPAMLIISFLTWLWLQIMYMGLFRPKSKDACAVNIGEQGEQVANKVLTKKYNDLGSITWHESIVGFLFLSVILLWFFRKPDFVPGWPQYITNLQVKDSVAAMAIMLLLFAIPTKLDFLHAFDKDPNKRPTKPSPGLVNWKTINQKMHWGMLFVLGGGFAIGGGSSSSGLSKMLGNALIGLRNFNVIAILFIVSAVAETVTELTANVAVANILLPVLADMSVAIKLHPLYLMMPATICCSFSFHLPVGTPPNAIVTAAGRIKTKDIIIAGIGPSLIALVVISISFSSWGVYVFDLYNFPDWANS